jgi:hypothetical protein
MQNRFSELTVKERRILTEALQHYAKYQQSIMDQKWTTSIQKEEARTKLIICNVLAGESG